MLAFGQNCLRLRTIPFSLLFGVLLASIVFGQSVVPVNLKGERRTEEIIMAGII
jgi:hypothetical protein